MIKVWTDLNTALFSSSFRLTEPKISRFSEICSGMSKSEKKSCCLRVVWRGQSNKKWDTVSVIPQIQFGDSTRFLIKRCAYHFIILDAGETEYYKLTMDSLNVESATKVSLSNTW
jgi:hypothetical protein